MKYFKRISLWKTYCTYSSDIWWLILLGGPPSGCNTPHTFPFAFTLFLFSWSFSPLRPSNLSLRFQSPRPSPRPPILLFSISFHSSSRAALHTRVRGPKPRSSSKWERELRFHVDTWNPTVENYANLYHSLPVPRSNPGSSVRELDFLLETRTIKSTSLSRVEPR